MKIRTLFALLLATTLCAGASAQVETKKVPKYTFSNQLEKQQAELAKNPTLKEFANDRIALDKSDRWRPDYHFTAPDGKLNDPNGLCFWQGKWHMFYQAYPTARDRKIQHWGHAISDDMIHWVDLPWALYPDADDQKIYSGTALVEKDRVIAIHHTPKYGNYVAVASDPLLLNWERLPNPVVRTPERDEKVPYRVFDPCIWRDGDYYYALSGSYHAGIAGVRRPEAWLFRSKDLKEWSYMHPFVEGDQFAEDNDDRACPYFWPIGSTGKHILLSFSHFSGGHYTLGTYDRKQQKFIVYDGGGFNHGPTGRGGFHAPSATPDPNSDGVVTIFNLKQGFSGGGKNWNEAMTLPRLLTLDEFDLLQVKPFGDYQSLRGAHRSFENRVIEANKDTLLPELEGNVVEMEIEIDLKRCKALELDVLASPGKQEYSRIVFYREAGHVQKARTSKGRKERYSTIMLDTSLGSLARETNLRQPEIADVYVAKGETLKLHIFLDRSIIEVFANDRQSLVLRAYPTLDESRNVIVRTIGAPCEIVKADAWQMKSIYKHKQ